MRVTLDVQYEEYAPKDCGDADDATAEFIARLSPREAELLWATLVRLKPDLLD